jgi:cyclopropane-fatty-acyl-phospholipid synthase
LSATSNPLGRALRQGRARPAADRRAPRAATAAGARLDAIARLAELELRGLPVQLRLWDGTTVHASEQGDAPTVVVRDPRAIAHLLRAPGELGLARAWVSGQLELDGDLEDVLRLRERARRIRLGWRDRARLAALALTAAGPTALRRPPIPACEARVTGRRHTLARDRRAISHHYDVSNRFYELLLGPSMCYSSACFDSAEDSLDAAQERKLELICRKLRLAPGERLLDVGCGWGSLVLHAARRHGVRAVGVTLSRRQAELARERVRAAGQCGRVEVRLCDYRELADGPYDKIASIGMYEHVGIPQLPSYALKLRALLRPGGLFLNSGIARLHSESPRKPTFIGRYVFPDGELPQLSTLVCAFERAGLEVRHIDSLREHYQRTVRAWHANLTARRDEARVEIGDERLRTWQLYLLGSALAFADGDITVFHLSGGRPAGGRA